ncbi:MAG: hypothetical protein AAF478_07930 [Pseudomonadota bacterium]
MNNREQSYNYTTVCFGIALLIPIYFAVVSINYGLRIEHIVHHDARHHIVWLQRYIDPDLFPGDLTADYFQASGPIGFQSVYWFFAKLGIEPLTLAKFLPLPIALIASIYWFKLSFHILPSTMGAVVSTLLFNQGLWLRDGVISATPRAYAELLLAAFLFHLLKRHNSVVLLIIALQALFYPILVPTLLGILAIRLLVWSDKGVTFSKCKRDYLAAITAATIGVVALVPSFIGASDYGPLVTSVQMKTMPEFLSTGRSAYYGVGFFQFWLTGDSGLRLPWLPPTLWIGVALPFLIGSRYMAGMPILRDKEILWQVLLVSVGLYVLAHIFFIKLYFPNRHVIYGLQLVITLAAGIVFTVALKRVWKRTINLLRNNTPRNSGKLIKAGVTSTMLALAAVVPSLPSVFLGAHYWHVIGDPGVFIWLSNQPKDTQIASLSGAADNLPSLSLRSVLIARNTAIPYHHKYYDEIRSRAHDLISAQYTSDNNTLAHITQKYGIDYWLVDTGAFSANYIVENDWLMQFLPTATDAVKAMKSGTTPILEVRSETCAVFEDTNLQLIDANCVLEDQ